MRISAQSVFACTAVLLWMGGSFGAVAAGAEYCNSPDLAIPDGAPGLIVDDVITVPAEDDGVITDVNVAVVITHAWMGDLDFALVSAEGTFVLLSDSLGGSEENMDIIFDDDGEAQDNRLVNCMCPVQPETPLSALIEENSAGDWTFLVQDTGLPDAGTLDTWCLTITTCNITRPVVACEGSGSSVTVSWQELTDSDGLTIFRDGAKVATIDGTETSYVDSDLASPAAYSYQVVSHSDAAACDIGSEPCSVALGFTQICRTPVPGKAIISLGAAVVSPVEVVDEIDVTDVRARVDIRHTWDGDLIISLSNPDGSSTTLFDVGGVDFDVDNIAVTFADTGVDFLSDTPTCDCLMKPSGPGTMADLIGESPVGEWVLTVIDTVAGDNGTLDSWCLQLIPEPVAPCPLTAPLLTCEGGLNRATLAWDKVDSDGFTLIRNGEAVVFGIPGTDTSYVDEMLAPGLYTYELVSHSDDPVCEVSSNPCEAEVVECPLTAPELSCEGGTNRVSLSWTDVDSNGFTIVRDGATILDVDPTTTSYDDEELEPGTYTYAIISHSDDPACEISSNECVAEAVAPPPSKAFIRGDANGNGIYQTLPDPLFVLFYQFLSGPTPPCLEAADFSGNGSFNALGDAVYGLQYAFLGGPAPPAPFPDCGEVLEEDLDLGCDKSTCTP